MMFHTVEIPGFVETPTVACIVNYIPDCQTVPMVSVAVQPDVQDCHDDGDCFCFGLEQDDGEC